MSLFRSSPSGKAAAELLRGVNLTVSPNERLEPCVRPRRFYDWDYFVSGGVTNGTIGRIGWSLLATGTPVYTRLSTTLSSPAKALLATGNVNNNLSVLSLGNAGNNLIGIANDVPLLQWAWRMNNSLATKRVFFGWTNNIGLNQFTANVGAFGVLYDSGVSPNYILINKFGTAVSRNVITDLVVPQNSAQFFSMIQADTSRTRFHILVATDSGGIVTEQYLARDVELALAPGIPSYNANQGFVVTTLAAVSSGVELGYWGMVSNVLGGLFGTDDAILEH